MPHDLLAQGAILEFDMGPEPSDWGTAPDAAPPSITSGDEPAALAAPRLVDYYTLTSASTENDPPHWVLLGSADGRNWKPLDIRAGEQFTWRRQTRPFRIAGPGRYRWYRFEWPAGPFRLAEVELFASVAPTPPVRAVSR